MGILNLTPDSFFDGGRHDRIETALAHARRLIDEGADILDLGAESSRPGAAPVDAAREQERLLPVLTALRRETNLPLSVDTVRSDTARAALDAGADAVNDISAGGDPGMFDLVARHGCGLILMHMQGTPRHMQNDPRYDDVVAEVATELTRRRAAAEAAGIGTDRLMVDPGIGFGKTLEHNLALLAGLARVGGDLPLLLGASRKSFIGRISGAGTDDRLPGSLAALVAAFQGRAAMVRVHDVAASVQFLDVLARIAAG